MAPTIEELADKMNALVGDGSVDLEAMRAAATRYDACIDRGPRFHDDEQLRRIEFARRWIGDRLRTCKFQKILDPKAGPLVAIREFIISRKSMGGIADRPRRAAYSTAAGEPIAGLYAAGESAGFGGGGMNGKRGLEGTFLGGCLLGGRIAGRVAWRLRPQPRPRRVVSPVAENLSASLRAGFFTLNAKMIFSTPVPRPPSTRSA